MNRVLLSRIATCSVALAAVTGLSLAGASAAWADIDERSLSLTRQDGSPIGTLFTDWTMVPGDNVSTTVIAHREGGGSSTLLVTLGGGSPGDSTSTLVEEEVVITIVANGTEYVSSAADLMRGDMVVDLGRSSLTHVPIDVSFELPFDSANESQSHSLDLSLVVVATDTEGPETGPGSAPEAGPGAGPGSGIPSANGSILPNFPNLPSTGASIRDALIAAAVATCLGLLLIGRRRRRDEAVEPE